jgi:hypothetical protein
MGITKDVSVNVGGDLADLIARVRLAAKRDDDGAVQAAQFLRVGESLYMVTGITATRGAVNGETVLTLTRLAGEDGPPVALISSRSPAPCSVARATDAEVIAAASAASAGIAPVHLNPPAPRPVRAAAAALRPVDFDAPCAAVNNERVAFVTGALTPCGKACTGVGEQRLIPVHQRPALHGRRDMVGQRAQV